MDTPEIRRATSLESSLATKRLRLRPVQDSDVPFLYMLSTSPQLSHRWRMRGVVPPIEQFAARVWDDVLAQFIVVEQASAADIGWVQAMGPDQQSGHISIGAINHPAYRTSGYGAEATGMLVDYLFRVWRFRKVYMEAPEFNYADFAGASRWLFTVEGHLKDHIYYDGQFWDQYILSITREAWEERGRRLIERLRPAGEAS